MAEYDQCPNQSAPILYADSIEDGSRFIIKARCKLWSCPYCGKVNAHQHWIRILNGLNELQNRGQIISFVTLTSHEKLKTPELCLAVWRNAWRKLRARLQRIHEASSDYDMVYVIVTEKHKDGRLHWHMLNNVACKSRWYKDNGRECGLGYQSKSIRLNNAIQGTNYCTKYLTKSIQENDYPRKMRRIVYSESFPDKRVPDKQFSWQVLEAKDSIVNAIEEGWRKDLDVYLNWQEITEIVWD